MDNKSKVDFWKEIIVGIIVGVVVGFCSAYFSSQFFGKKFEHYKTVLNLNEKLGLKQVEIMNSLSKCASELYIMTGQYKRYDLITNNSSLKLLLKYFDKYPKPSDKEIFNLYAKFLINLIAAKPFVDREFFEKLSMFSIYIGDIIFLQQNQPNITKKYITEKYEKAGKYLNAAFNRIRYIYKLEKIPSDILSLNIK